MKKVKISAIYRLMLSLSVFSTPLYADRILMIGDSWSWPVAPQLQTVLHENGHTDIAVDATRFVDTADDLQSQAGLDKISTWLNERPDVTFVQLSIGANDWGHTDWTADSWSSQQEDKLIAAIIEDVDTVVEKLEAAGYRQNSQNEISEYRKRFYFGDKDNLQWEFIQYMTDDPAKKNHYE